MDDPEGGPAGPLPVVATVDEDLLPAGEARRTARLYFVAGFALLPWLWVTNVWLFFPDFWHGGCVHRWCQSNYT